MTGYDESFKNGCSSADGGKFEEGARWFDRALEARPGDPILAIIINFQGIVRCRYAKTSRSNLFRLIYA